MVPQVVSVVSVSVCFSFQFRKIQSVVTVVSVSVLFLKYTSKQTTKQYIYYIYFYNQIKWKVDTEDTEQTKEKLKTDRKQTKKAEM